MALTPTRYTGTTDLVGNAAPYQVGILLKWTNKDTAHAKASVEVIPLLRRTSSSDTRYQHKWDVAFAKDGVRQHTENYRDTKNKALPNDTAQSGVVAAGKLTMVKNIWYQWGSSYKMTIPNDGQKHTVGVWMNCLEINPRYCPAEKKYLTVEFTMPKYSTKAPTPAGLETWWYPDTRKLDYRWTKATGTSYIQIYRTLYDENDNVVKQGYIDAINSTDNKIGNADLGFVYEILPKNVVKVVWKMANVSSTGTKTWSNELPRVFDTYSKVYVCVNGVWKKAIPWVKVNGAWKKVSKTWVKVNGAWKKTKI